MSSEIDAKIERLEVQVDALEEKRSAVYELIRGLPAKAQEPYHNQISELDQAIRDLWDEIDDLYNHDEYDEW